MNCRRKGARFLKWLRNRLFLVWLFCVLDVFKRTHDTEGIFSVGVLKNNIPNLIQKKIY